MSDDPAPHSVTAVSGAGARLADRYELEALLGSGAMGTVYRAFDTALDEPVAIKVLRREAMDTPGAVERFRREVRLARRVTHRNVARTYDIARHEDDYLLTMEYIDGDTLSTHAAVNHPLSVEGAIEIARQMVLGLEAMHDAGVVHRDLKPNNVMIARDGRVVVMDFGIAQAARVAAGDHTTHAALVGTPAYMAPEQLTGLAVDGRADLYAFGVLLFEVLAGEPPWLRETTVSTVLARLSEPPPDLLKARPDAPPELAELIHACLARDPDGRPERAAEVGARLAEIAGNVAANSQPTTYVLPSRTLSSARDQLGSAVTDAAPSSVRGNVQPHTRPSPGTSRARGGATARSFERPPQPRTTATRTVAVLPLLNRGNADDDYLADGLTEDLIDVLSMTPELRVRPWSSVAKRRDAERDARSIGSELGVEVVVDGSVRRAGDRTVVRARLIGVEDGYQLWAKRFTADPDELLEIGEDIARAVASALTTRAAEIQPRRAPTDPTALDLYFRARHEYNKLDPQSVVRAVELFEQAVERAPSDARVLTGSALARARQWFFGGVATAELAVEAAERALRAAPDLPEPRLAYATIELQRGELVSAVEHTRVALLNAPALADAHALLGKVLAETGPAELALSHLESARQLDPTQLEAGWVRARVLALTDRAELALRALADARDDSVGYWLYVARLAIWRNDRELAERVLSGDELGGSQHDTARRLFEFIAAGRREFEPEQIFNPGLGTRHSSGRGAAFRAQICCELTSVQDDASRALDYLGEAVEHGLADIVWTAGCPLLEPVRSEARFAELVSKVEARAACVHVALTD